jgi:hypothetical protein
MRGTSSKGMEDMPTMDFLNWNGVRFSKHREGGDHLASERLQPKNARYNRKTESRSRKPERAAPENQGTCAPENQSACWNKRSRKPEQREQHNRSRKPEQIL